MQSFARIYENTLKDTHEWKCSIWTETEGGDRAGGGDGAGTGRVLGEAKADITLKYVKI